MIQHAGEKLKPDQELINFPELEEGGKESKIDGKKERQIDSTDAPSLSRAHRRQDCVRHGHSMFSGQRYN